MSSDLTFITNEKGETLENRFSLLIKHTEFFDCLVGYFYASGFYTLIESLKSTEKIRVLIGISTNPETFKLIRESQEIEIAASSKQVKNEISVQVVDEMDNSADSQIVEEGVSTFIDWLQKGKLEIRVYPSQKIHAKLYIMTFKQGNIDKGRVITGSSNFSRSGLRANIEFNVELKNRSDYEFSLQKFNDLWEHSIDVSEEYVETINNKTWINNEITPYDMYVKFLYEYFKEKINLDKDELVSSYLPSEYMELEYQKDAVRSAKLILDEYGGVFISDVVGLGKTYVSAMLAQQLNGRHLVIAPPALIDKNNPGSWPNVFGDFGVRQTDFESIGTLDKILKRGVDKYTNIFIDEAHRFRTDTTQMYENLFAICRGKRVILVSATPLNNTPIDILSQIKLFQNVRKSTLPNPRVKNLEKYFIDLQTRLKGLDRQKDKQEYLDIVRENSENVRENVLRHLMVRRTRSSIVKYYSKDLAKQKIVFPEIQDPEPIYYQFDGVLDSTFNQTLDLIINEFKYSRYVPLLYFKRGISQPIALSQTNMRKFLKILLLKRLESSFYAFKQSITRFIASYRMFIEQYENGRVFVSKKYTNKIFELLEHGDDDSIDELISKGKAQVYNSSDFQKKLHLDLKHDLAILLSIQNIWKNIDYDPKLEEFRNLIKTDPVLSKNKIIVFSESKETAKYLASELSVDLGSLVIAISSESSRQDRLRVLDNFDANIDLRNQKNDLRVLISTDVLSEGVSLHRSNVVVNYDIPWNPVRMMQRVGRVNRVSKQNRFKNIYTYNFFPAGQIDENISLKDAAISKITAFIEMLGNDAKLLTDEEIKSHDLFSRLSSKSLLVGEEEDDPELPYLIFLRDLRDRNTKYFEKIKRLPRKARTGKQSDLEQTHLLTFFRKGKLRKIFFASQNGIQEIDFIKAVGLLKSDNKTPKLKTESEYYTLLEANKQEFDKVFSIDPGPLRRMSNRGNEAKLVKIIKAINRSPKITIDDEEYLDKILDIITSGGIAKKTTKRIVDSVKDEIDSLIILNRIKRNVSNNLFQRTFYKTAADIEGPKEVILSEYLVKKP